MSPDDSRAEHDLLVVLGPTASGKTRLAVALARALDAEIISADSRQVYRELEIGAGKDRAEYIEAGIPAPVHLLDAADLGTEYSVFHFQRDCYAAIRAIRERGKLPILAGGTGLYIEAVLQGYRMVEAPEDSALRAQLEPLTDEALRERLTALQPHLHNTTDTLDRARLIRAIEIAEYARTHPPDPAPAMRPLVLGVRWPRETLRERIRRRLRERIEAGLIEEVAALRQQGVSVERLHNLGLEYRYVTDFLEGRIRNRNDLVQKLAAAIIQFAKRQETWFRRMERNGCAIHWIDGADPEAALALIRSAGLTVQR